jgi:lipopolysaccharide/colanic/teichoic acid biosynthesis glycosyltransferase
MEQATFKLERIEDSPMIVGQGVQSLLLEANGRPFVPLKELSMGYRIARRSLDIVFSAAILLVLFPFLILVSIAVAVTSRGPIFYQSMRVGVGGKIIPFLKFRTMVVGADSMKIHLESGNEQEGPIFKIRRDPRITKIGAFLRKYSIDEIPQFIHVLTGEMTLVGPRPHLPNEVGLYEEHVIPRLSVKPGLTCFWQIRGRSDLTFEEWVEMDLQYIREMNFWLDLKILAKTPYAILHGKGAY